MQQHSSISPFLPNHPPQIGEAVSASGLPTFIQQLGSIMLYAHISLQRALTMQFIEKLHRSKAKRRTKHRAYN